MAGEQEIWIRGHNLPGRHQGGGKIQEQRAHHQPEAEAHVPHALGEIPRTRRLSGERGTARFENSITKGRYCNL